MGRPATQWRSSQAASRALTGVYSPAFLKLRGYGPLAATISSHRAGLSGRTGPLHLNRLRVLNAMEINPILNTIKDLSERTQTIRGYL